MKRIYLFRLLLACVLASSLIFAGCAGDDGTNGAPGMSAYDLAVANGYPGTEEQYLASGMGSTVLPAETCTLCHDAGSVVDAEFAHSSGAQEIAVNVTDITAGAADLVVTFTVDLDGAAANGYTDLTRDYRLADVAGAMTRLDLSTDDGVTAVLASTATAGEYTITLTGAVTAGINAEDSRYMFRIQNPLSDVDGRRAIVLFDYPGAPIADVLTATGQTCENCHGAFGDGFHYGYPANNGKNCTVCHDAENTNYPYVGYIGHGIHSSASMPSGSFDLETKDGLDSWNYAIAFPSYMNNCSNCHEAGASLDLANAQTFDFDFCTSCHETLAGLGTATAAHDTFDSAQVCTGCHGTDTVQDVHNAQGMMSERGGMIVDGYDASVTEGARVNHMITGVSRVGDELSVTWGAELDGVAVDPCETDPAVGPTFQSGYSLLRAVFFAGDPNNADNGATSPGQPLSTNLDFVGDAAAVPPVLPNTTCVGTVATTTVTLTAEEAVLTGNGRVALQGKPVLEFAPADPTATTDIQVRAKTPVYDYALADGAMMAPARRAVTDSAKCTGCHKGSLYQHGGNRIDNVEMCIMCHNEASSEQNVRVDFGVDASEAYDGKAGQTYGFKSMLHAVHASGHSEKALVIYRGRGIYAFAADRDQLSNWPGEGSLPVYGSDDGTGAPVMQNHNFVTAHYPRDLNACSACHTDGFAVIPDATEAQATTVYAGAEPWDNQLDDGLQGPVAAACLGCHQSGAAASHAYKEGWYPSFLEDGRQSVVDAQ
jgi:OmcA/MtrC family decaheme c-type cytochrome